MSGVTVKGMLLSLNSRTATKAASTIWETMSATASRRFGAFKLRTATTVLYTLMSHAQNSSEPSRPAHRPERR